MKKLSKQMDKAELNLRHTCRDALTGQTYTMHAYRPKGAALLLYLSNVTPNDGWLRTCACQTHESLGSLLGAARQASPTSLSHASKRNNAQAVFSDADLDTILAPNSSVLYESLARLGLQMKSLERDDESIAEGENVNVFFCDALCLRAWFREPRDRVFFLIVCTFPRQCKECGKVALIRVESFSRINPK